MLNKKIKLSKFSLFSLLKFPVYGFLVFFLMQMTILGQSKSRVKDKTNTNNPAATGGDLFQTSPLNFLEDLDEGDFEFSPSQNLFPGAEEEQGQAPIIGEPSQTTRKRRTSSTTPQGMQEPGREPSKWDETKSVNTEKSSTNSFNYDQADLVSILKIISEMTGMNFIIHPNARNATVTIQTADMVKNEDLPKILQSILEVNNLAGVVSGNYMKIVPLEEANHYNTETIGDEDGLSLPDDDRLLTFISHLNYIEVADLQNVVSSLIGAKGNLIIHENTNTMIISATATNINRMMKIIRILDVPSFKSGDQLYVYYLEHGNSEEIATVLNSLYSDTFDRIFTSRRRTTASERRRQSARQSETPSTTGSYSTQGFEGAMIQPAVDINALIIKATPQVYRSIEETIKKIDIQPKQVFIEVLIAEVTLDEEFSFGIEWQLNDTYRKTINNRSHKVETKATNLIGLGTSMDSLVTKLNGFNYMLSETNQLVALLNTKATESKLNVLASPTILASDNKEASIAITDEVPIEQRDIQQTGNVYVSYVYRDAGIKLKVTPHINESGNIALDVEQEVSEISNPGTKDVRPTFRKRTANTSIVIKDSQTLAIGGLIEELKNFGRTGIPFLSKIPVLGYLFRSNLNINKKTELVILLTPHVVYNTESGIEITEQYKSKLNMFQKNKELPEEFSSFHEKTGDEARNNPVINEEEPEKAAVPKEEYKFQEIPESSDKNPQ